MTTVIILLCSTIIVAILSCLFFRFGSEKNRTSLMALGVVCLFVAFICGFFTYEEYNTMPIEYSVGFCRENSGSYQLTLDSSVKGLTGGSIYIKKDEALVLGYAEEDDEGNIEWTATKITTNRQWVDKHRSLD